MVCLLSIYPAEDVHGAQTVQYLDDHGDGEGRVEDGGDLDGAGNGDHVLEESYWIDNRTSDRGPAL